MYRTNSFCIIIIIIIIIVVVVVVIIVITIISGAENSAPETENDGSNRTEIWGTGKCRTVNWETELCRFLEIFAACKLIASNVIDCVAYKQSVEKKTSERQWQKWRGQSHWRRRHQQLHQPHRRRRPQSQRAERLTQISRRQILLRRVHERSTFRHRFSSLWSCNVLCSVCGNLHWHRETTVQFANENQHFATRYINLYFTTVTVHYTLSVMHYGGMHF